MTDKEILKYNKMCAKFLGWKYSQNYTHYDDWCFEWEERDDGVWYKESDLIKTPEDSFKQYYVKVDGVYLSDYEYRLKFDSDWNFIMEVVEAIEKLERTNVYFSKTYLGEYTIEITHNEGIREYLNKTKKVFIRSYSKQEAVVQAINQFLIWYNKQEKL